VGFAEPGIAVVDRESEEGASFVIDRAEIAVGDQVQRLLAAIVRMRAPADVGNEAGRVAPAAFFRCLGDIGGLDEAAGPVEQLLGVLGRPRAQYVEILRGRNQSVPDLLARGELREQQPLAHAEGGDHNCLRLGDADDVLQHQCRISEQRTPRIGDSFDFRHDATWRHELHPARERQRLVRRDRIAVHHAQRIVHVRNVQPRQRAPGATDGVERAAAAGLQRAHALQLVRHDPVGTLDRFVRHVLQRKPAERQAHAGADALAVDVDQFERAAAEVADDPVGPVHRRHHTKRRQLCFARTRKDLDPGAENAFALGDEIRSVVGFATGRGRDHIGVADMHDTAEAAKSPQRGQRARNRVRRQQARRMHLTAEAAEDLFVEERRQAARQRLVDDETHGV
jgi:hypothetical protein